MFFGLEEIYRWHDNHALLKALETSEDVIPVFIFDPNILDRLEKNDKRVSLLFDRIKELNALLENDKQIHILCGDPSSVFKRLFKEYNIGSLFCNEDYEPYALERDQKVRIYVKKRNFFSSIQRPPYFS